jgi:hypothetical protein
VMIVTSTASQDIITAAAWRCCTFGSRARWLCWARVGGCRLGASSSQLTSRIACGHRSLAVLRGRRLNHSRHPTHLARATERA